jgi:hypothetical protein
VTPHVDVRSLPAATSLTSIREVTRLRRTELSTAWFPTTPKPAFLANEMCIRERERGVFGTGQPPSRPVAHSNGLRRTANRGTAKAGHIRILSPPHFLHSDDANLYSVRSVERSPAFIRLRDTGTLAYCYGVPCDVRNRPTVPLRTSSFHTGILLGPRTLHTNFVGV